MGYSIFPLPATNAAGKTLKRQVFISSGIWTHPNPGENIEVISLLYGGGGGGGGGGAGQFNTSSLEYRLELPGRAGSGGSSGNFKIGLLNLNTSAAVIVGAGGQGGSGGTYVANGQSSAGSSGTSGGISEFDFQYNLLNGVQNGAAESRSSALWRSGASNNSAGNYPSNLTTAYNTTALTNAVANLDITGFNITNVTSNSLTSFLSANVSGNHTEIIQIVKVDPNTEYTLSAYATRDTGTASMTGGIALGWLQNEFATTFISNSTSATAGLSTSSVHRFTLTATSPANATHVVVRLARWMTTSTTNRARFTGVLLQKGNTVNNYVGINNTSNFDESPYGLITVTRGIYAAPGSGGAGGAVGSGIWGGSGAGTLNASGYQVIRYSSNGSNFNTPISAYGIVTGLTSGFGGVTGDSGTSYTLQGTITGTPTIIETLGTINTTAQKSPSSTTGFPPFLITQFPDFAGNGGNGGGGRFGANSGFAGSNGNQGAVILHWYE
jgi:hypothetical protein